MKRLGILTYKSTSASAYGYLIELAKGLRSEVDRLVLVCSGEHGKSVAPKLQEFVDQVLLEQRPLFDMNAYGLAVSAFGAQELAGYDEVVFVSGDVFGPLSSLREVFLAMDKRADLDFWGITRLGMTLLKGHSVCPYKERPEHLQLYFLAVRQRMLASPDFVAFFEDMPRYRSQLDVTDGIECVFTPHFAARGFAWGTYVDDEGLVREEAALNNDISVIDPYELIAHRSMPFLRKDSLTTTRTTYLAYGTQHAVHDVLEYVRTNTSYDVGLMYEWLLSEVGLWQIQQVVGEVNILPDDALLGDEAHDESYALADMVVVALLEDPQSVSYLVGVPAEVPLYVVCDGLDKGALDAVHAGHNIVVAKSDPSSEACLAAACREYDITSTYSYVCALFDVRPDDREYVTLDDRYREQVFFNLVGTGELVRNVRHTFEVRPELGVLSTLPPNIGSYFGELQLKTWRQAPQISARLERLGCSVPQSKAEVMAKAACSFWCRASVLDASLGLQQGGDVHGATASLREVLPFVAQSQGYLTQRMLTPHAAEGEIVATEYMFAPPVRMLNKIRHIRANGTFRKFITDVHNYVTIPRLTPEFYEKPKASGRSVPSTLPVGAGRVHKNIYKTLSVPRFNEYMGGAWKKNKRLATVFSSARINAVEWLPMDSSQTVVEVGGSFGEYTHVFARRAARVYTYAPDEVRRALIAKRCDRFANVGLVGDLDELYEAAGDKTVDWLVIHDLEGTFATKEEVRDFVLQARTTLHPKRIALLCANTLGLRYATESWLVEKAELDADVEQIDLRFTKEELEDLFVRAGFVSHAFYYPHPDYVFTKTVFSDGRLPSPGSIKANQVWRLTGQRLQDAAEREALVGIVENGEFMEKCNSYIVVAQDGVDLLDSLPLYVRFPSDRKVQHSLRTEIFANGDVRKTCMDISGRGHIQTAKTYTPVLKEMYELAGIVFDPIDYSKNDMCYTYIEGTDLQSMLVDLVSRDELDEFERIFGAYIERIVASHDDGYFAPSAEFSHVFGKAAISPQERCVSISNIDLNVDNIIVSSDGTYHIIDCEWVFDFPIPVKYIVWRIIYFFFSRFSFDERMKDLRDAFYERYDIDKQQWVTFRKMETSFQRYMGL